jgi:hypothetical protein
MKHSSTMLQGYAWETCADVSQNIKLTLFSSCLVSRGGFTFNPFRQHGKFPKPWKVAENQTALITANVLIVWRSWLSNCHRNYDSSVKTLVPFIQKTHSRPYQILLHRPQVSNSPIINQWHDWTVLIWASYAWRIWYQLLHIAESLLRS